MENHGLRGSNAIKRPSRKRSCGDAKPWFLFAKPKRFDSFLSVAQNFSHCQILKNGIPNKSKINVADALANCTNNSKHEWTTKFMNNRTRHTLEIFKICFKSFWFSFWWSFYVQLFFSQYVLLTCSFFSFFHLFVHLYFNIGVMLFSRFSSVFISFKSFSHSLATICFISLISAITAMNKNISYYLPNKKWKTNEELITWRLYWKNEEQKRRKGNNEKMKNIKMKKPLEFFWFFLEFSSISQKGIWFAQIEFPAFTKNCTREKRHSHR